MELPAFSRFGRGFFEIVGREPDDGLGPGQLVLRCSGQDRGRGGLGSRFRRLHDWLAAHQDEVARRLRAVVYDAYLGSGSAAEDRSPRAHREWINLAPRVVDGDELDDRMRVTSVDLMCFPDEDSILLGVENTWDEEHGAWVFRIRRLGSDGRFELESDG